MVFVLITGPQTKEQSVEDKSRIEQKAEKKDHEKGARIACMVGINNRLKDPDSARYKHGPADRIVIENGPGQWLVQLSLKSKNNFNAYVHSTFACKVCLKDKSYELLWVKKI